MKLGTNQKWQKNMTIKADQIFAVQNSHIDAMLI